MEESHMFSCSTSIFQKDVIMLFNPYRTILLIPWSTKMSNYSLSQHHEFKILKINSNFLYDCPNQVCHDLGQIKQLAKSCKTSSNKNNKNISKSEM